MQQDNNIGQSPEQTTGSTTADDLAQIIMPTENKYSIKSYYFGCIGFIPFIGLPFSILAIKNGRKAKKQYEEKPTPGAKSHYLVGMSLAYFELTVFILFCALMIFFYLTRNKT